jgi:hypothetical protein
MDIELFERMSFRLPDVLPDEGINPLHFSRVTEEIAAISQVQLGRNHQDVLHRVPQLFERAIEFNDRRASK